MEEQDLKKQAEDILKMAKENGVQNNYFFCTTFERYQTLLEMAEGFKRAMKEDGLTTQKEYVKGRKNEYISPAVKSYLSTVDASNKTVSTLLKIVKSWGTQDNGDKDPLNGIINGDDDNE